MSRRQTPRVSDPQVIQFPRLRNGEVDWKTLSNVLVAQVVGDAHCISYVDQRYGKKDIDFEVDTPWRYSYEKDTVVVFKREVEDSPIHYFAGCSVINYPSQAVFEEIGLFDSVLLYEKYTEESRVVEVINSSENTKDCIVHRRYLLRNCLIRAEREVVFFKHAEYLRNVNKHVVVLVSVEHQDCPSSHIKRSQLFPGCGCVLEPYNGDPSKTRICWIAHVDLGGVPAVITNHIMKQELLSIRGISECLDKLQREGAHGRQRSLNDTDGGATSELPTPGTPHEEVKFSSVSVGSNPLYQQSWSMSARTPGKVFVSKLGSGECTGHQNLSDDGETRLNIRKISAVLEEPELEDNALEGEQSTDQVKEQSLMFEVSMQNRRTGLSINLVNPNK